MLPTNIEARFYLGLLVITVVAFLAACALAIWAVVYGDGQRRAAVRLRGQRDHARARVAELSIELEHHDALDRHYMTTPAAPRPALRDRIQPTGPVRIGPAKPPVDTATVWLSTLNGTGYAGSDVT